MLSKKYMACQNDYILGFYDTVDEAQARISDEMERDKLELLLKRRVLRRLLKKHQPIINNNYFVAEVKDL